MLVKKGSLVSRGTVQHQSYKPHTNHNNTYNNMNQQAPPFPPKYHRRIKPSQLIKRHCQRHPHAHSLPGHMHKNNSSNPCNTTKLRGSRPLTSHTKCILTPTTNHPPFHPKNYGRIKPFKSISHRCHCHPQAHICTWPHAQKKSSTLYNLTKLSGSRPDYNSVL